MDDEHEGRTLGSGQRRGDPAGREARASEVSYRDFTGADPRVVAVRYNSNGSLDAGFGRDGRVMTTVGTFGGYAEAIAMHTGGTILAAGRSYVEPFQDSSDFVVVRYRPNGRLDSRFGGDGVVLTSFGSGADGANALPAQSDAKIVAVGEVYTRFGLARYLGV